MSDSKNLDTAFADSVLSEYQALYKEIEDNDPAEHDLAERIVRHLFINALDYQPGSVQRESDWNDIRVIDNENRPRIIVETKRQQHDATDGVDQAFRYASDESHVDYWISTNIDRFLIYRKCEPEEASESRYGLDGKLIADINFEGITNQFDGSGIVDELLLDDRQSIQQLYQLHADEINNSERFDDFNVASRQSVNNDAGFDNLVDTLSHCLDNYFMPYALSAFDEFQERFEEYEKEAENLEDQIESLEESGHEGSEIAELEIELGNLREEYSQYREFVSDYKTWVKLSRRQEESDEENKRVFCRESVYVQLNKILLIRIAEDQGLTNQMISNGGVSEYFDFWDNYSHYTDRDYADLFDVASQELSEVYDHLYTQQIFDWPLQDGQQLNEVLKRTMWHLNRFDFSDVRRDVLGHLYEEHLDPQERKELGEFYTPTSVVDLILDQVGYNTNEPIEQEGYDLLDPACGSGTFLVRAANRLRERLEQKGVNPKQSLEIIQSRLHGLDLNPFATHICEMNMLFQVVDLYKQVKENDEDYTLDRFEIYQTDSLRESAQTSLSGLSSSFVQRRYQEEKKAASGKKSRSDYMFVVGNPPYVRSQNLPDGKAKEEYDEYYSAYYNYDIYCLFVEQAKDWLKEDGKLGYIISNKFLQSRYGERLRELVPIYYRLEMILDFNNVDVFRSAKAFPLIFVASRTEEKQGMRNPDEFTPTSQYEFTYGSVETKPFEELIARGHIRGWDDVDDDIGGANDRPTIPEFINTVFDVAEESGSVDTLEVIEGLGVDVDKIGEGQFLDVYPVPSSMVSNSEWRFVSAKEEKAMSALEEKGEKLQNYCVNESVERGLRTGNNDAFLVSETTVNRENLESELLRPIVSGKEIQRWATTWDNQYIIYTQNDTSITDYPNIQSYLNTFRDSLEDRWCVSEGDDPWYALDKTKSPSSFERNKIITPDIVLYNNFWLDQSGEMYCLNTAYYINPKENELRWFLLGILNSNAIQFYYRRIAPTYKDQFLRYISEYLEEVPIPNVNELDTSVVDQISRIAEQLQNVIQSYNENEKVRNNPELITEKKDISTNKLAVCEYITSMNLSDGNVQDPTHNENSIQLNVNNTIECDDKDSAKKLLTFINALDISSINELKTKLVPQSRSDLNEFITEFKHSEQLPDELENEAISLEKELNDAVYDAFELDEDVIKFIEKTVETPKSPVRPKAMSDE